MNTKVLIFTTHLQALKPYEIKSSLPNFINHLISLQLNSYIRTRIIEKLTYISKITDSRLVCKKLQTELQDFEMQFLK